MDGRPGDTYEVARLTGPRSSNRTHTRWNVWGTDLGHSFEHRGRLYFAFGDTFGPAGRPPDFGGDWRSNVLARSDDANPRDGIRFDWMATDRPRHAKEILSSGHGAGGEQTVIPTNGSPSAGAWSSTTCRSDGSASRGTGRSTTRGSRSPTTTG